MKLEMSVLGSPRIRAIWTGDAWEAIEGSHRIAAAHALDLPVEILEIRYDDVIPAGDHDLNGYTEADGSALVSEIVAAYYQRPTAAYSFEIIRGA